VSPAATDVPPAKAARAPDRDPDVTRETGTVSYMLLSNNHLGMLYHAASEKPRFFIQLQPFACWNNRKFGNARMTASVNSYEFDSNALQSIPITEALPYLIPTKYWVELADIAVVD
jgi:hypothetical protein